MGFLRKVQRDGVKSVFITEVLPSGDIWETVGTAHANEEYKHEGKEKWKE